MSRAVVLALVLCATACGKGGDDELAQVKTSVCACKTVKCAEDAMKAIPQHPVDSNHRSQQVARDMLECLSRLYAAQRQSTDPDAPADPAPTGPETSAPASAKTP